MWLNSRTGDMAIQRTVGSHVSGALGVDAAGTWSLAGEVRLIGVV